MQNKLGPLATLVGTWEGNKGEDRAPSPERGVENNKFREVMSFEVINEVDSHEQILNGLRYRTTAWENEATEPFHEEVGYWLWDAQAQQVMKCFLIPRGVSVIAGGTSTETAEEFTLSAELGSPTYGICSNLFLDKEFKTVKFDVTVKYIDHDSFSYDETTLLQIKGQKELFKHTDKNILTRVK